MLIIRSFLIVFISFFSFHSKDAHAARNPEQWSAWKPLPKLLKSVTSARAPVHFRVSNHYRAQFKWKSAKHRGASKSPRARSLHYQVSHSLPEKQQALSKLKKTHPKVWKETELCLNTLQSGGSRCLGHQELQDIAQRLQQDPKKTDALQWSRQLTQKYGLRATREILEHWAQLHNEALAKAAGNMTLEERFLEASKAQHFAYSVWNLTPEEKEKTHFFFVLGLGQDQDSSETVQAIFAAKDFLLKNGFKASVVETKEGAPAAENAPIIRESIEVTFQNPALTGVVLSASKGSQEMSHFMIREFPDMHPSQQQRLRIIISLSGVLRYSYFAKWLSEPPQSAGPTRKLIRQLTLWLLPSARQIWNAVPSLAEDPWTPAAQAKLIDCLDCHFPKWISLVMFPSTPEGRQSYAGLDLLNTWALKDDSKIGPTDGIVESAASLLPTNLPIEQHIIRARGAHGILDGQFIDGTPISEAYSKRKDPLGGGEEFVEALLNALPAKFLTP